MFPVSVCWTQLLVKHLSIGDISICGIHDDAKNDDLSCEPCVLVTSVVHQSGWGESGKIASFISKTIWKSPFFIRLLSKANMITRIDSFDVEDS